MDFAEFVHQLKDSHPMRKRIIPAPQEQRVQVHDEDWLTLADLADVEVTSEDPEHPIESALLPNEGSGWRAAQSGQQTIRLLFHSPQRIRRVRLEFSETNSERTQQFVLRWSTDVETSLREIVRQQWNFSPHGATIEHEDYCVELQDLRIIELCIIPDMSGRDVRASLDRLRLA